MGKRPHVMFPPLSVGVCPSVFDSSMNPLDGADVLPPTQVRIQ